MAGRRKGEAQLQIQVESQEEWEELLSKEGVNVVDVYQEWCGPCSGMLSNFKKMKNEIGDPLLKFVTAKADTIDSLDKYRGHCEPCFLFYAGGCLVAVVRGANSPKILRTITEQLKQEHKVLDGSSERKEIKDPFIAQMEAQEKEGDKEEEEEEEGSRKPTKAGAPQKKKAEVTKEVTVALIKPDAVAAGKVDQILEDIKAHGIEILRHEERHMTEDEVRQFYSHLQDQEFFEDLVKFMTSGPSHILALTKGKTGGNIISEFRDLLGPTDVEEAKNQQPESLRAKHGQQTYMNALHGSSSSEMASRELAFFFPDFVAPTVEGTPKVERTLALVRPAAFRDHKVEILESIRESGFKVAMQKEIQLDKEMAEEFYKEHKGQEYFDQLITNMTSGPVLALGLAREDAIQGWRNMLGPKEVAKAKEEAPESLRAKFAVDDAINTLHGSDSADAAKKEIEFFFPMEQTVAVIKPDADGTKEEIIERIHEAGFRIAARKETQLTREIAEEFYADHKDKEYYNDLVEHMTSGPTYLMVLSREGAVEGWRSMIGPTDPAKAKEEAPDSIRATYGQDILKNAVHGSSNVEQAHKTIKTIFGDLKFTKQGELEPEKPEEDNDGMIIDTPTEEQEEKPQAEQSKEAEESAPEVKQKQAEEEASKKEEPEQQEQQKTTEEQPTTEESKTEQSQEDAQQDMDTKSTSSSQKEVTKQEVSEDQNKEETEQEVSIEQEKRESPQPTEQQTEEQKEEPKEPEKTEEKAPSPKPSESEAKPSETEAKPSESEAKPNESEAKPSETEAKPSEGDSKPEEQKEGEAEQKTETPQGDEEKKDETKTEEKTPEPASTEEKKED